MTNQNQNQDPLDPLWILSQDQDPTRCAIRDARNPIREMGNRETRNRELRYQSQSKSNKPFANNRFMRASGIYKIEHTSNRRKKRYPLLRN